VLDFNIIQMNVLSFYELKYFKNANDGALDEAGGVAMPLRPAVR
jgi:hypothetical protein